MDNTLSNKEASNKQGIDKQSVYKKFPYASIEPLLVHFDLSEQALEHVKPQMPPAEALAQLWTQQLYIDAINLLAYSLPRRESIWWACQCLTLRQAVFSEVQIACLDNAKLWLQDPVEVLRRRAEYYAKRLGSDCGPGWLALAVFWNGSGSIIASGEPEVMPKPFLYAAAVAGAVNLTGVKPEQSETVLSEYYRRVFDSGLDIASGGQGVLSADMLTENRLSVGDEENEQILAEETTMDEEV
ncbi:hypothetical protein [Thalassomonas sp. RHCl1]|uniref:DUF6931 family protein n=1 Tax=Thalassomonas sp. RHCl1 TaxID=2995320 RepID=UPI00248C0ECA|nr:hypothetical protein [Thalassomonas sp. RHCl1]